MPQVPRDVVKDRARRLRQKGEAALLKHLDAEVGARRNVLIELNQIGRTEGFTPVRFSSSVTRGDIATVTIAGHNGRELLAA
jgi:threonylcarbamoyladenosine tRNA methylthiotransferase MtaB